MTRIPQTPEPASYDDASLGGADSPANAGTSTSVETTQAKDTTNTEDDTNVERNSGVSTKEDAYRTPSQRGQSIVLALATFTGVAMMVSTAALSLLPTSTVTEKLPAPLVSAHPSNLVLGCLDAVIDPFNPLGSDTGDDVARVAAPALLAPTGATSAEFLLGGKPAADPPSHPDGKSWGLRVELAPTTSTGGEPTAGRSNEVPHAAALVGQKGGELRGLSILPCTPAALEHWFALGSTSTGEDVVIRVSNTGSQPSVVTLAAWGASGPLDQLSQGLVVGAGETLSLQPGRYFPDEERLLVRLNADGAGISAWLHTSAMAGEVPQGSAWIASTLPSSRQVIPGLTEETNQFLRLAVPPAARPESAQSEATPSAHALDAYSTDSARSTDSVEVRLRLIDASGSRDIPGGALTLAENSVLDISLPEVKEPSALIIEAAAPVVAQVLAHYPGTSWPSASAHATLNMTDDGKQYWKGRGALTASSGVGRIHLPSATALDAAVTRAFEAAIVRPTSVTTPADGAPAGHELYLVNPTDTDLMARYGGKETLIPAGTSLRVPLSAEDAPLDADEGLHAAIIVRAKLPTGRIDAVWPLGTVSLSRLTRAIDLR